VKRATENYILRLRSQGKTPGQIAGKLGKDVKSVVKFLDAHPVEEPEEPTDELADLVKRTRDSCSKSIDFLERVLRRMEANVDAMVESKTPKAHDIKEGIIAYGVMVDKVPDILKTIRLLEAEAADDIEAGWEVVVREE
jgi:hypothetical protein